MNASSGDALHLHVIANSGASGATTTATLAPHCLPDGRVAVQVSVPVGSNALQN